MYVRVICGETPSLHDLMHRNKCQSLELMVIKHSQSLGSGILEPHGLSKAVILVCLHNAVQQASLARICIFLWRSTGALWSLVIVTHTQGVVGVVVVFLIIVFQVNIVICGPNVGHARSIRG